MKQVLLLDDDRVQLTVRQLLLQRGGIESRLCNDPEDALVLLSSKEGQETIGAVITDHLMPGMDGAEFVRRLRAFDPWMPVIVVSGLPDAETAYQDLKVSFLTKPCEPEDLIALVRTALTTPMNRASA
jgi:DNA-binding NtrC family response regulator